MSILRLENISPDASHVVGVSSGVTVIALWSDVARHLTVIASFMAALFAVAGAFFYAAYWGLKMYAKWHRIKAGVFEE